ncbi:DUF4349 domain-containing protein [Amycolatopsis acidicola]|uniref:DUF4349 domain-containing protein n=1 Tax=Amycolatopsis acidicola TaxID=2596893 RepID=A0A5N0VEW3_9PSEU|nr:DUF4349 domain-containing protein [Amycolatopsis acidicola]KAA9164887.1 DUF4349 domain-containing protein [Amycolatopsis acidicola]
MRSRFALAGALALLALTAGCTGNHSSSSEAIAPQKAPAAAAPDSSGGAKAAVPGQQSQASVPVTGQDRQLVRTAELSIVAPDVRGFAARARQVAAAAGGYSGSETTDVNSSTLNLVVPSDRLDAAVDQLGRLGEVTSVRQNVQDVTDQSVDVASRIDSARRSLDRVRALFDQARSISDLTSLESELSSREADLESLQSRQNALASSVAMSTVMITATVAPVVPPPAPEPASGFLAGLAAGWHGFLGFGGGVLRVVGAVLPFLVVPGIPLGALTWFALRRRWFRAKVAP